MTEGKLLSNHPLDRDAARQQVNSIFVILITLAALWFVLRLTTSSLFPRQWLYLAAALIPVATAWAVRGAYRLWLEPAVDVYEEGLRYSTRRETRFWRWEMLNDFRALRPFFSQAGRFGLYVNGQRVLLLDDRFQRSAVLINRVMETLRGGRGYEGALEQGETLRAGALQVNRSGVKLHDGSLIPWADIRTVRIAHHQAHLQIDRAAGGPVAMRTHNIPNAPLLVQFIALTFEKLARAPIPPDAAAAQRPGLLLESRLAQRPLVIRALLALAGVGAGAYLITFGVVNALQYDLLSPGWIASGLLALVIPVLSAVVLIQVVRLLLENPRLVGDETGLHRYARSGETYWRWNDFSDVKMVKLPGWFLGTRIGLALDVGSERALTLDDSFASYGNLGLLIQRRQAEALYPQFKTRLEEGEMLSFGPVTLDGLSVRHGNRPHLWSDVASFDLSNTAGETHLIVYGTNGKRLFATTIFGISNLTILNYLLHERLTGEAPKFSSRSE